MVAPEDPVAPGCAMPPAPAAGSPREPKTIELGLAGPIARLDIPVLCARARRLLESGDADVENGVLIAMLAAGESQDDVCRAVAEHAAATGLRAVVSDREDPVMVVIESSGADGA